MSWFVRERFAAGQPIPADLTAPANGSPLFRVIVRRQIMSLDFMRIPLRFWRAASMNPDALSRRTLEAEWPLHSRRDRRRQARDGRPHPTSRHEPDAPRSRPPGPGLRLRDRRPTGPTTIRVYDPNWPDRDDITLHLSTAGFRQSTGEPLLGVIGLD